MKDGIRSSGTSTRGSSVLNASFSPLSIEELHRLIGGVVERVRVAEAAGGADGSLELRCAAIHGELGFAIEDDVHLLAVIVKMVAEAALRPEDATVDEVEVGVQAVTIEQDLVIHFAGPGMNGLDRLPAGGIGMGDTLREGFASTEHQQHQ